MLIIGKEDYEELKGCLSETFEEIEKIKSEGIKTDGEHFHVEWWVAKTKSNPISVLVYKDSSWKFSGAGSPDLDQI